MNTEFQRKNMSSSGKIRVPAEEYVIYYPPTDQSDSRITLNCSITISIIYLHFVNITYFSLFALSLKLYFVTINKIIMLTQNEMCVY